MNRILDKETCHKSAVRFDTRTRFCHGDPLAYQTSRINGWLDEWLPKRVSKPSSFTYEVCYGLAKKCKSRAELSKLSDQAYMVSLRNGWLDDYTWFKSKPRVLDKEICRASARRYKTRCEFRFGDYGAYRKALTNGWINEYDWFLSTFEAKSRAKRKFSDEEIEHIAKKYTRTTDFMRNDKNAFYIACNRGLIKQFTWLKHNVEAQSRNYVDCVYAYEFRRHKTAYIGRTIAPKDRDRDHREPGDSVCEFAKEHNMRVPPMKIIAEGFYANEGGQKECEFMEAYRNRGWTLINKAPGGSLGTIASGKYTKSYCIKYASKFEFLTDLINDNYGVYNALRKYGWIKECPWLKYKRAKSGTFTKASKEQIAELASHFKSRREFSNKASAAYHIACKNKWLDEWFPQNVNMVRVCQYSLDGKKLNTYNSVAEAGDAAKVSHCCITDAIRGRQKTAGGFIWLYEGTDPETIRFPGTNYIPNGKPVIQYTLDGKERCHFESITVASLATGIRRDNIYRALSGGHNTAGGFIWKYSDVA